MELTLAANVPYGLIVMLAVFVLGPPLYSYSRTGRFPTGLFLLIAVTTGAFVARALLKGTSLEALAWLVAYGGAGILLILSLRSLSGRRST